MAKTEKPAMVEMPLEPASANLVLPDKQKLSGELENVGIGKLVDVRIRGKVRAYTSYDFDTSCRIEIEPTSIVLETEDEEITLDDAISGSQVTV